MFALAHTTTIGAHWKARSFGRSSLESIFNPCRGALFYNRISSSRLFNLELSTLTDDRALLQQTDTALSLTFIQNQLRFGSGGSRTEQGSRVRTVGVQRGG